MKSIILEVRVSKASFADLKRRAKAHGMNASQLVRDLCDLNTAQEETSRQKKIDLHRKKN